MKLSKIYSNRAEQFQAITFNDQINVIFGRVKFPKDRSKDSHNLGKSILIDLIDFMLLKKDFSSLFLGKNESVFSEFEFFLEVKLGGGGFVTIRRSVGAASKISLKKHAQGNSDFTRTEEGGWDHFEIPIGRATGLLDGYFNLTEIAPWGYRQGVSYFLRTQRDYLDVFQIGKFAHSNHKDWKPYLTKILGFDHELVERKYSLDDDIAAKEQQKKDRASRLVLPPEQHDKLRGSIEIKENEIAAISKQLDSFDFHRKELQLSADVVSKLEAQVAELNDTLYNIRFDIQKIERSLELEFSFDLSEVKNIFDEVNLHFKDDLVNSYDQLIEFNKQLSADRKVRLKERLKALRKEEKKSVETLKGLNEERVSVLAVLRNEDTFSKYKGLQKTLVDAQAQVVFLKRQMEELQELGELIGLVRELKQERESVVERLNEDIKKSQDTYRAIRKDFDQIIHSVLGSHALLSIDLNEEGNLEFDASILRDEGTSTTTSEGDGTTYRKLLCAAFDLAILKSYSDKNFYHFVYHDGVFEGLDNRKKNNLMRVIREICEETKIQYILTVIDTDLPRDDNDEKVPFESNEIVRELSDEGDSGRLFKMSKF